MRTHELMERFKKEYGMAINEDTIYFYDRINLIPIPQQAKHKWSEFGEKEYIKLSKAILLSQEFNMPLEDIDKLLNKHDNTFKDAFLKRKARVLRILKETL